MSIVGNMIKGAFKDGEHLVQSEEAAIKQDLPALLTLIGKIQPAKAEALFAELTGNTATAEEITAGVAAASRVGANLAAAEQKLMGMVK